MDTFSASDLYDLTPEEILAGYTYRIAELSSLIQSNLYILQQIEKSREVHPKQAEGIERLMGLIKVVISENKTIREHLNLDAE